MNWYQTDVIWITDHLLIKIVHNNSSVTTAGVKIAKTFNVDHILSIYRITQCVPLIEKILFTNSLLFNLSSLLSTIPLFTALLFTNFLFTTPPFKDKTIIHIDAYIVTMSSNKLT